MLDSVEMCVSLLIHTLDCMEIRVREPCGPLNVV